MNDPSPPKLPSVDEFKLHNILNNIENSTQIKQQLVNSILQINSNYTKDLDNQFESLIDIENDEIIDKLANIQSLNNKLNKLLGINQDDELKSRYKTYSTITQNLNDINGNLSNVKPRIDKLVDKLKKIESNFSKKDQLFKLKSPHESHYNELFKYAMKSEIEKDKLRSESKSIQMKQQESSSSTKSVSKSPLKLQQYLSLESEIEQLQKSRSKSISKGSNTTNPINLIINEASTSSTTCTLNNELIVINERKQSLNDQNDLVNDLKQLMKR